MGLAVFETCSKGTQHCTVLTAYHFTLQTPVNTCVNQQQGVNGTQKPYLTKRNNHGWLGVKKSYICLKNTPKNNTHRRKLSVHKHIIKLYYATTETWIPTVTLTWHASKYQVHKLHLQTIASSDCFTAQSALQVTSGSIANATTKIGVCVHACSHACIVTAPPPPPHHTHKS